MRAHYTSEACLLYSLRNKTRAQYHQISRACAAHAEVSTCPLSKLIWPILRSVMTTTSLLCCAYGTYYTYQSICEILQG